MPRKIKKGSIILLFLVSIIITVYFYIDSIFLGDLGSVNFELLIQFLKELILNFSILISFILVNGFFLSLLNKRMPFSTNFFKRISIEIVGIIVIGIAIGYIFSYISQHLIYERENFTKYQYLVIKYCVSFNFIGILISEGYFFFRNWQKSLIEKEKMEKERINAQYEALKAQLNPHFLFNSLSVLSSIIQSSPQKAEKFVDHFAHIYRYILDIKDSTLIELKREVDFLNSFVFLLKIRFEDHIKLDYKIDAEKLNKLIPPLTLQILIENAIKHNEISAEKPLIVEIFNKGNYIIISNNINKKNSIDSKGIGLSSIKKQYEYFDDYNFEYKIDDDKFIVKIPLLEDE